MNVDISPNLPPSSSWTAAAEFGEGLFGCGRSSASLSNRVIIAAPGLKEKPSVCKFAPSNHRSSPVTVCNARHRTKQLAAAPVRAPSESESPLALHPSPSETRHGQHYPPRDAPISHADDLSDRLPAPAHPAAR